MNLKVSNSIVDHLKRKGVPKYAIAYLFNGNSLPLLKFNLQPNIEPNYLKVLNAVGVDVERSDI